MLALVTTLLPVPAAAAEPPLTCAEAAVSEATCQDAELAVWRTAAGLGLAADRLAGFCGAPGCTLREWVAAELAAGLTAGVRCELDVTCDLYPVLSQVVRSQAETTVGVAGLYATLTAQVDAVLREPAHEVTPDDAYYAIAYLSGGPAVPAEVAQPVSGNAAAGGVRAYGTAGSFDLGADGIPKGCTAAFQFGRPFFFKRKAIFDFWVDFHYGQHLDWFQIVDTTSSLDPERCPGTSALLDLSVRASFRPTPLESDGIPMNARDYAVRVTAYPTQPYVNCYDPDRCSVVLIETDDRRPSIACCTGWPFRSPYFWHVGEYTVDLYHTWELTHGYDSQLYGDPEDGYIGDSYNQSCVWTSGGFDPHVPTGCRGDG